MHRQVELIVLRIADIATALIRRRHGLVAMRLIGRRDFLIQFKQVLCGKREMKTASMHEEINEDQYNCRHAENPCKKIFTHDVSPFKSKQRGPNRLASAGMCNFNGDNFHSAVNKLKTLGHVNQA